MLRNAELDGAKIVDGELFCTLTSRNIDQLCNDILVEVKNKDVFLNWENVSQNMDEKTRSEQKVLNLPSKYISQYSSKDINTENYMETKVNNGKGFVNENEFNFDTSTSINSLPNFKTIKHGNQIQPSIGAATGCQGKDNLTHDYKGLVNEEISKRKYMLI